MSDNPTDLTTRNARASRKRDAGLRDQLRTERKRTRKLRDALKAEQQRSSALRTTIKRAVVKLEKRCEQIEHRIQGLQR